MNWAGYCAHLCVMAYITVSVMQAISYSARVIASSLLKEGEDIGEEI